MDFEPQSSADGYSQLTDDQLRSAIKFAEQRMRWADEDHVALTRAYRDEIAAMRRHLFDRLLSRLISPATRPSLAQTQNLQRVIQQKGILPKDVAMLIRAATKGRTDQLDSLTEIEILALCLRLEQQT